MVKQKERSVFAQLVRTRAGVHVEGLIKQMQEDNPVNEDNPDFTGNISKDKDECW